MAKQPGVMLYFDVRPSLKRLSNEDRGRLFEAILDYGEFGEVPDLEGPLAFVWDFVQPRLDRDAQRYRDITEKRREAAMARWGRQDANAFDAEQTMPTTTSTTTTTSTSSSTSASTPPRRSARPREWQARMERERDFNARRNASLNLLDGLAAGKGLTR